MRAATIRDVAERAAVSVASVSRVLTGAGPVAEETRARVLQAVEALQYVPHSGARSLSTRRTQTLGVVLPDLYGEFFSELIRGMDVAARAGGYHLMVSSSHDDAGEAQAVIRSMRGRVDGLIVMSPHLAGSDMAALAPEDAPVVLMNGGACPGRAAIVIDNHGGAVAAVEHLIAQGRRRIAHISGPVGNIEAEQRLAGYMQATAAAGLEPFVAEGRFTQASGAEAARSLLGDRPDAVFAGNDNMAVGAMLTLRDAGLSVPEDVAVVGFDDVPLAELVRPALTTLRLRIADMGRQAVETVLSQIRGDADAEPGCAVVQPELIVRASSGGVSAPRNPEPNPGGRSLADAAEPAFQGENH